MKYKDLNLMDEWTVYIRSVYDPTRQGFKTRLRARLDTVAEKDKVTDRLRWCQDCANPHDVDGGVQIGGSFYCTACWDTYHPPCAHCGQRQGQRMVNINNQQVCNQCQEKMFFHCRHCGWQRVEDMADHLHGADGCCASPALEFTVPVPGADGTDLVRQDEKFVVDLSTDNISRASIGRVVQFLVQKAQSYGSVYDSASRAGRMYDLACRLDRTRGLVGYEVTTKEGNFGTRLKRYAYKNCALKLDPDVLAEIGNLIASDKKVSTYTLAFTRDVNQPAAMFAHGTSCWWTEYAESRCLLKSNGGLGVRAFDPDTGRVIGRCWLMPMKRLDNNRLAPTFDTHSGLYFAFNGYGTLEEQYPTILAHALGVDTFVRYSFEVDRYYVNNSRGNLLGSRDIVSGRTGYTGKLDLHSDLFQTEQNNQNQEVLAHV